MTITEKIRHRIHKQGRGWVFTPKDFIKIRHLNTINPLLDRLEKRGEVRSLGKGIYQYPIVDHETNQIKPPSLESVVRVIEVQHNDRFFISAEDAKYELGLTNTKPQEIIYLSNKLNKQINVCGFDIKIKKTIIKIPAKKYDKPTMAILALRNIGKYNVNDKILSKIFSQLTIQERKKLINIAKPISWIHRLIKDFKV
jgi:predicted transcriptional regulator of viral defense system